VRLRLTWTLFLRESRGARGRLLYFVLCLALGVGAVTAVAALVSAVRGHMAAESRDLLAADVRLSSRAPLPQLAAELLEEVEGSCEVHELATMLAAPEADGAPGPSRLVELKATGPGYPFYGELLTEPPGLTPGDLGQDGVLVAAELVDSLSLAIGDAIELGGERFELRGAILTEPDRLEFGFTLGPRAMVSQAGLARTELVAFGSRVRYARLLRLAPSVEGRVLDRLERRMEEDLESQGAARARVQTHREAQPSVQRWLRQVERYLGLVALLSLLLGGVGVAQVVRVWIAERTPAVAIQRSLGLRPREILQLYLSHVLALAALASAVGCAGGLALPFLARFAFPELFEGGPLLASPAVALRGLGLGLGVAALFALGPLTAIYRVSPARVLRSEAAPLPIPRWVRLGTLLLLLAGLFGATWLQARDLAVAAAFSGGLLALVGLLVLGAKGVLWLAARLPRERLGVALRHGLASLARPGAGITATVVALGLGVHVVVSMILVEGRLSRELRQGLPEDAPSLFLVDVQPDQWPGVEALLADHGALGVDSTPVAMARLAHVDGTPVRELARESERSRGRARWVLTREQRLTWRENLPDSNRLLDGAWFQDDEVPEVSLEQRYADDLGATVGTRLGFDLQGVPIELVVTSLREVDWSSFSINFFLLVEPGAIEGAPHWRLASARVEPEAEQPLQDELVADFRNVTLLRLRPVLEKVAALLERIALGVRSLGWVAVAAGLAILAGAVAAGGLRRKREVALQKTLGMTRRDVLLFLGVEYALVGLVAGLCGAGASYGLAHAFLRELLELEPELPWGWLPLFVLASGMLSALCGLASSARVIQARPALSLR